MKKIVRSVRRFDLGEMQKAERTPQGFLKVPGFATRTGVFPYIDGDGSIRYELRHPDDVFDPESLATLKYVPVTIEHPPGLLTPETVRQYSVGHATERVEVNRDMVDTDLIIEDQAAIDTVEEEGVRELSSGYSADVEEEEGTWQGIKYNFRQKNIRYNHIAIVKKGRAGPEVRLRLDSADAIMRNDDNSIPTASDFATSSAVSDAEDETKKIVLLGKEMDLPADVADLIQDMTDRYDEMRAKLFQLEEEMGKQATRKDVDISQKGISPQVDVKQMGPDGTKAPSKVGPGDSKPHPDSEEEKNKKDAELPMNGGPAANKRDEDTEDGEDEKEEKGDIEQQSAAAGGGAAISPLQKLQSDYDSLSAKHDEMKAKLDAFASESMNQGESKADRNDSSKDKIRSRVKLERQAEKLVPFETANKFDSMTDEQIRCAVIQHRHPKADLKGKSMTYLETRFDSIVEEGDESTSIKRSEAGKAFMGQDRNDSSEVSPDQARLKMRKDSSDLWKSQLSANKK